jgi:hypothetical protein
VVAPGPWRTSATGWVGLIHERRAVVHEVETSPLLLPPTRDHLAAQGVKQFVMAPLALGEDLLGAFNTRFQAEAPFAPEKIELAHALMTEQLNADQEIEFRLNGAPRPLPPDVTSHRLRIGQEALTNALRHAQASEMEFGRELRTALDALRPASFRCRVERGRPPECDRVQLAGRGWSARIASLPRALMELTPLRSRQPDRSLGSTAAALRGTPDKVTLPPRALARMNHGPGGRVAFTSSVGARQGLATHGARLTGSGDRGRASWRWSSPRP